MGLTEFAVAKEHDEEKIVEFIHQLIPMLEKADFIWRYSWFYTRYYPEYDDSNPWFWIDPVNSLLEQEHPQVDQRWKGLQLRSPPPPRPIPRKRDKFWKLAPILAEMQKL